MVPREVNFVTGLMVWACVNVNMRFCDTLSKTKLQAIVVPQHLAHRPTTEINLLCYNQDNKTN